MLINSLSRPSTKLVDVIIVTTIKFDNFHDFWHQGHAQHIQEGAKGALSFWPISHVSNSWLEKPSLKKVRVCLDFQDTSEHVL